MHLNGNVDAKFLKPLGRHGGFLEMDKCCCFRSTASTSRILPMWDGKGCVWSPLTEQPAHFHGCRYTWPSTTVLRAVGLLWLTSVISSLPATWGLNMSESWFFGGLPNVSYDRVIAVSDQLHILTLSSKVMETRKHRFQVLQAHACNLNVQFISFFRCSYFTGWWTVWTNLVSVTKFQRAEMP